ncbi:hypothetical protein SARC_14685 [Sphaeroforma arctica JP610]|uniref:NADH dehydrogenase [ubiquinone] 1 alpha subcomplex subunit 12 n=1 Tax=Sphaeroforma arctica JP610 TaxID=667725 RepID=A0A0L0F7R0_9EUKA|nr:hypothetical protein SARC_14685 [Sphaeroforma arctica JP610]KNC72755.1 hypothetical protein SARC_14685 [Sphaeroforma arctica JP610]|eukprot:XP_014146657.1 hypothetical protein SARC_14685 [Sphaeroforma arctica JP610]
MFKALSKMLRSIDKANHNGKLYVGKDSYGNMFYELTPMTQGGRRKRIYEPPNDGTDPQLSITQEVSAQWRSWLNGTR